MGTPWNQKLRGVVVWQDGVQVEGSGRVSTLDFLDSVITYDEETGVVQIELGAGITDFGVASLSGASNTLELTHAHKYLRVSHGSGTTVTVPANASVAFPVGTPIHIEQDGAGQVTVAADVGVTIRTARTLLARTQYSVIRLVKVATNEWVVDGDLQAV